MPDQVDECVESVLDDHPEYSKSRAYAICNAQQNGEVDDQDALLDAVVQLARDGDMDRLERISGALGGGAGQKSVATIAGEQAPLSPSPVPDVDPENPPEEFADALDADEFVVYGKASIEKFDDGGQNSDTPEILDLSPDVVDDALERFFGSEKAPGIISIGHDDIPVGRPLREYTLDEAAAIEVDGDVFEFDAGDTITTHVEDGDGDGRPELWLVADLAKDTPISRKARLGVLTGDLDGFSVTFGRIDAEPEGAGRRVTDWALHSVTLAPDDLVANEGAEFDLAAFKAAFADYQGSDDATDSVAEALVRGIRSTMTDDDIDEETLIQRLGQKLTGEADEDEASTAGEDPDGADAGQKQPEDGGDGNGDDDAVDELLNALADEMGVPVADLRDAVGGVGQNSDDEEDDDEPEDGMKTETDTDDDAGTDEDDFDFGAKAEEHGLVDDETLDERLEDTREAIVDALGQKLAETNREAVEEIAQKMDSETTPTPAGGSYQDAEDFEDELEAVAEGDGW